MSYSESLANKIRESLVNLPKVEERNMFGGVCFMVDDKMCIGVVNDEMMCRIGPDAYEEALEKKGCRQMNFTGKEMKGYVFVSEESVQTLSDLDYWIQLCLAFNPMAKASKKKAPSKKKK